MRGPTPVSLPPLHPRNDEPTGRCTQKMSASALAGAEAAQGADEEQIAEEAPHNSQLHSATELQMLGQSLIFALCSLLFARNLRPTIDNSNRNIGNRNLLL
eukprot:scaffold82096_cov33-Tisochrysis_lutea.AAC.1